MKKYSVAMGNPTGGNIDKNSSFYCRELSIAKKS